tara:strand:+ start:376 stop:561 length:186 start_codon:yes stop_codon:yes gene_type:complete
MIGLTKVRSLLRQMISHPTIIMDLSIALRIWEPGRSILERSFSGPRKHYLSQKQEKEEKDF